VGAGTRTLHCVARYGLLALRPQLLSISKLPEILESEYLHAVFGFSEQTAIDPNDQRLVSIGLDSLSNRKQIEVWCGAGPVSRGRKGRIHYTEDSEFLFGHMLVSEDASVGLAETVKSAYDEVLEFARSSSYPNLYRVWHYLPDINHIDSNLERYRAFCVGRHAALAGAQGFERNLPAASAIGTHTPGLLISFVAGRGKPSQIENPRQVSAFNYPSAYGPRSPLFSRAMWIDSQGGPRLYLSGTASILGHESVHPGDLHEQIEETLRNMEAILANAPASLFESEVCLRVYIRNENHYRTIRYALEARFGESCSIVYLRGDICRSELLLEIEGVFGASQY
jgi:chorismate lyase / 3-hydroxybenzoate synthase